MVNVRRDDPELRLLLGLHRHLELDGAHDARGGKEADVAVKQAVNRDLPALLREDKRPQLAGPHKKQAGAVRVPIVQDLAFFDLAGGKAVLQPPLLICVQLVPDGEKILNSHGSTLQ